MATTLRERLTASISGRSTKAGESTVTTGTALVEGLGARISSRTGQSTEATAMSGEAAETALVERLGTGIGRTAGQATTRCITHDTDRGNREIRIIQQDQLIRSSRNGGQKDRSKHHKRLHTRHYGTLHTKPTSTRYDLRLRNDAPVGTS
uniref:Uncharacterized protein n=1 Tax=Anopheles christyi TaxID=43041 RepID=A0A182KHY4_9DIPT